MDRSLGRYVVADALREAGARVEVHHDHFEDTAPDVDWLHEVGRRGWVVLTKDMAIRRRLMEREAIIGANVRAFFLTSGELRGEEMAAIFAKHLRRITSLVASHKPPFIAYVTRSNVRIAQYRKRLRGR